MIKKRKKKEVQFIHKKQSYLILNLSIIILVVFGFRYARIFVYCIDKSNVVN